MPLDQRQVENLGTAILQYAFPPVYFDFEAHKQVHASDMREVERAIRAMLVSSIAEDIRNGLANIIYWGYAQIGYRDVRVRRFREGATLDQLARFRSLVEAHGVPSLSQVHALEIPEYSGISFISKVLMFLDPVQYCVLDQQLARLGDVPSDQALQGLSRGTRIPVSPHNEEVYDEWRAECRRISAQYFGGRYRVVDVERGFFQLVQSDRLVLAQRIYAAA